MDPSRRARLLAGLQAADLVVTQLSSAYGDDHLDHLGVPAALRPALPMVKAVAVGALLVTSTRPRLRSVVSTALLSYYSAAIAFHIRAGDSPTKALPAAGCAALAGTLV